ncbi:MAG: Ldh family oxidoreductase [Gammaproteobacteria bacterium]|nr:Ldh family oxidoreductase [Gammaproteobacteria bacterium]MBT5205137.1 Ldh family oxidoreductase [Gammaproteobacteria bacterium]MBT5601418.1 Ldh family oxidoreductase [Gammaproteobacteria bacterium]MBT6246983.1 Ldh family oxidoreductase [Gammaproteobacteria bacterium]
MPVLSLDEIRSLCHQAVASVGASEQQAAAVALEIMDAEAEGIRNVGLGYIHLYLKQLKSGKILGKAVPEVDSPSGVITRVDAGYGFCHTAYLAGEELLIGSAKNHGMGMMAIHRSSSAGVLGWFVRRLAQQGLVGLMFANSSRAVAAHGGKVPFFGTNPFAFGSPRQSEEPLVFDMATASTARVNIVRAANEGRAIEPGHAIDKHGKPTTDAGEALKGAQLPLGGAKGFGLGLMVDMLAGVLTGSHCSYEASLFASAEGGPPNVGQLIIAIDSEFMAEGYVQHLEEMFGALTMDNEVRIPGERRAALRRQHELDGVEVPQALLDQITGLAG